MKIGEERITKEICCEHECFECGEPATHEINYLLEGTRRNPQSSAYGRDDCSWCSDDKVFTCEEHKKQAINNPPIGMVWCSDVTRNERFEHLFLYWKKV